MQRYITTSGQNCVCWICAGGGVSLLLRLQRVGEEEEDEEEEGEEEEEVGVVWRTEGSLYMSHQDN